VNNWRREGRKEGKEGRKEYKEFSELALNI
jgi:hypothetical protein